MREKTEAGNISDVVSKTYTYKKPPFDCLKKREPVAIQNKYNETNIKAERILAVLDSFGISDEIKDICYGPTVTGYVIEPNIGIKISKIIRLADDIAFYLGVAEVRVAELPGKTAICIEVPNSKRATVGLRECIDSYLFRNSQNKLSIVLGKDIAGKPVIADLTKIRHLLIGGTVDSGKTTCLYSIILSLLYSAVPDELRLILIDCKQVDFSAFSDIPHLEIPVVSNPREALGALAWAVTEAEKRCSRFAEYGVRDIDAYNELSHHNNAVCKMPRVIIIIDEIADLMMIAPNEVEESVWRLARMAHTAGIHLVITTQRPSLNVITGIIKESIPSKIAFRVLSNIDSRVVLGISGAEKLIGNGDMLFMPVGESGPKRLQGCFVSESEIENIVDYIKQNSQADYNDETIRQIDKFADGLRFCPRKESDDVKTTDNSEGGQNAPQ